jgi:hypothetical protein
MRKKIVHPILSRLFISRIGHRWESDSLYQHELLKEFLSQNKDTERGKKYWFVGIETYEKFSQIVPLSAYDDIQPYIERMLCGERDILWKWEMPYFSKSSWTTAVSKYLPITYDALEKNHFKIGQECFGYYLKARGDSRLFAWEWIIMWGRLVENPYDVSKNNVWDVSAILQFNAPRYTKLFRKPSMEVSFMENFDAKLNAIMDETIGRNITYLAWVPSWLTLFLQRVLEKTGKKTILDVWPWLELFMWWGINIAPYKKQLSEMMPGEQVWYWQNYNASEWFFGIQDKVGVEDMLLATQHHVFYEFIPFEEIDQHASTPRLIADLEIWKCYEMIITTSWWLRRYRIGDVIEVTGLAPVRIRVSSRTKSFINAFGEELMVHTTDGAIEKACEVCWVPLAEYVATPIVLEQWWYHQRYVDFGKDVQVDSALFAETLEAYIQEHNSDYKAKRWWDILMKKLQLTVLPPWTFHAYLAAKGKLGGQHKIKRLWNVAEELRKEMGEWLMREINA